MPHFENDQEATMHKAPTATSTAFFQAASIFTDFVGTRELFKIERFYFHLRAFQNDIFLPANFAKPLESGG